MRDDFRQLLRQVRATRPLVHAISGAVTAPFIADVLGAMGAVAALTHDPAEAGSLAMRADALLVNLSQPDPLRIAGAMEAARAARIAATPWVLDPVLAHASARRRRLVRDLLAWHPAILKPNRAELAALATELTTPGDKAKADDARQTVALARSTATVVLTTGETDIISNGERSETVRGGHAFMDTMSGYGCALGAAAAAFCTVTDAFSAALAAARAFAEAGTQAAMRAAAPASFRTVFLDTLYHLGEPA